MPAARPESCPECGHGPLVPLSPGCCPECGFEYDDQTRVWRPRRPWRIYILYANTLLFSPWLFQFLQVALLHGTWPSRPVILGAVMSLGSLLWALPRIRVLLSEGHRYAALTPRGIEARTPKNHYLVPWHDLAAVSVLVGVPRIRRRSTGGMCTLDWIFDTDEDVRTFLEQVEQHGQQNAMDA